MSTPGGRRPISALAALALTGALAACSGGSGSSSTSTALPTTSMTYYPATSTAAPSTPVAAASSTAATTSAAPTAAIAPPVMPAEAKAHTPDGAAAFARYYMDLINYSWQKPDEAPLRRLSRSTCKACLSYADFAEQLAASGTRVDAKPYILHRADPADALPTGEQIVTVVGNDGAYRLVGNTEPDPSPAAATGSYAAEMYLIYENEHWTVAALEKVE